MKKKPKVKLEDIVIVSEAVPVQEEVVVHESIPLLPLDYPSEGLNNMARTINKLIEKNNAL